MKNTIEDEREIFEDAVRHFVTLAALVAVNMNDKKHDRDFQDDFKKRLNWLVHCAGEYEATPGYQGPRQ